MFDFLGAKSSLHLVEPEHSNSLTQTFIMLVKWPQCLLLDMLDNVIEINRETSAMLSWRIPRLANYTHRQKNVQEAFGSEITKKES